MPAEWRRWAAFLRHPEAPPRANLSPGPALRAIGPLFGLDLALMALLLGTLGAAVALGLQMPEHMLGTMKLTPALVGFIVIAAPIGEEIVFRGWLSGRPGHILASILAIGAVLALAASAGAMGLDNAPVAGGIALGALALLALAALALFLLRKRDAIGFYRRHFGWFFYASAVAFAAIHLSNFAAAGPAMLPMVLPQHMLALVLGYLRVRHGLWSSILLHMLHNSVFVGAILASGG